jgi:L-ascorbate metabolism protein UlaG (beta-lactamase superfamily)
MEYLYNKELVTIKNGYPGNEIKNGMFSNYEEVPLPKFNTIIKWQFTKNPQRDEKKKDTWKPDIVRNDAIFTDRKDKIVWLGHASFLITINGKNLLIDPVFNDIPFIKRIVGIPFDRKNVKQIDYVLLSHAHFDHCDKESFKTLAQNHSRLKVLTGLNMQSLLHSFAKNMEVQEAGWYQQYKIDSDEIEIYYLPAFHWYKRTLNDINKRLWGSFIIKTKTHTIFFMGDSGYNTHFKEIASYFPNIDICIMGVGAYKPSYIMKTSHTSPEDAVKAFHDLGGKTFIPMHYGTYDLADEPLGEPVRILDSLKKHDLMRGDLNILKIGETFPLETIN